MIEPVGCDGEPISLLDGCRRRMVERPHAFIGSGVDGHDGGDEADDGRASDKGHIHDYVANDAETILLPGAALAQFGRLSLGRWQGATTENTGSI
jgi:hypothetical protein